MAVFIKKLGETPIYAKREVWRIMDRFQVTIHFEGDENIIFIDDEKGKKRDLPNRITSSEVFPKIISKYFLSKNYGVEIWPSIDTCGIIFKEEHTKEIFSILEKYLEENYGCK